MTSGGTGQGADGGPNGIESPERRHGARLAWRVARARNFAPYFVGAGVSASGTWFHNLAASVLVAEVAGLLGDSKRVAADHYVYALTDGRLVRPVDRAALGQPMSVGIGTGDSTGSH